MRVVAIVNARARAITPKLRARIEQTLPGHVRFTETLDEARATIRRELRRGVDLVILGGGDGTVVMGLTLIGEACRGFGTREPMIAVLRLGSGNAIADTVAATDDVIADLARLSRGAGTRRVLPLIEVLGVRAPFVGMGLDAQLLEDHEVVGRVVDRLPGGRFVGGATRYALSVALRSVPRFALGTRPNAIVTNLGRDAIELVGPGDRAGRSRTGELWRGPCTLVAGSTIPYFGFGLKMFAFAESRSDAFHLRCGEPGLFEIMRNTPAAFRGEYFSERVHDFLCDRVAIELDREAAIEAGGELLGRRSRVELALGVPITVLALGAAPSYG
ncbi:MAG: diacylglycerol kinase family protein [Kofleriaceae bacterium]